MSKSIVKENENINLDSQFSVIVSEYKDKIYRLSGKFFKERSDREDIVQETFLKVYTNLERLDNSKNVSAWIYRIGTNICIDMIRKNKNRHTTSILVQGETDSCDLLDLLPSNEKTPEEWLITDEVKRKIEKIIKDLPQKWKPFIYQQYVLEMSIEEMSIANDMPISTVKSRLHRARSYLQRRLHEFR